MCMFPRNQQNYVDSLYQTMYSKTLYIPEKYQLSTCLVQLILILLYIFSEVSKQLLSRCKKVVFSKFYAKVVLLTITNNEKSGSLNI